MERKLRSALNALILLALKPVFDRNWNDTGTQLRSTLNALILLALKPVIYTMERTFTQNKKLLKNIG